ncbi:MAG: DNA polymerase Y family protein [Xanthobacteraceae bacterium]|jgi:protein ImuB
MSRIVSVWLPRWPSQRFLAAQAINPSDTPVDPERPFVLVIAGAGGPRLAGLNAAAEQAGLALGDPLADARAKAAPLQVRTIDAAADADALRRLALWATRYTPTASPWLKEFGGEANGADGFFLDIEGSAHLFGGEDKLIADLATRLDSFGLKARLAVAATPGAAWAASRFHRAPLSVLPSGQEAAALAEMPIAALRLTPETRNALRRLGFKTVGSVIDQPRAPFAARFAAELLRRLDQALGRVDEPLVPIVAPPVYHSLHYWLEPIVTAEAIVACARRLMQNLVHVLVRDDVGAHALRLCLYRVDGAVETIDIGLTLPTRDVSHVTRLIDLKLEAVAATQDAGFGFEAIGLAVTRAEAMPARQTEFTTPSHPSPASGGGSGWGHGANTERGAALIDALRQRLGPHRVRRFAAHASHLPERAEALPPIDGEACQDSTWSDSTWPAPEQTRPLFLLPRAEPTEVTALVPDGPPRRFYWRGVTYDVTGSQGPERIAAEWWRHRTQAIPPTRDYYLVEDAGGHRFWLFREGLYGRETAAARWFVQGLFA